MDSGSLDCRVECVQQSQPGATTRKNAVRVDRSYSGNHVDYDDSNDEDGTSRKYSKRGK